MHTRESEKFILRLHSGRLETTWHVHEDIHQLVYAEGGVLHLQTEHSQFVLPARHGAWIPARLYHKLKSNSPELVLRMVFFAAEENEVDILKRLQVFPISNLAREMILHMHTWPLEGERSLHQLSFAHTVRLMVEKWCTNALALTLPFTENPALAPVTELIDQNLSEELSFDALAERCGFSSRTLLRLFKRELGMTFRTYVRVARVIRALELLTRPDASITEVAYEVGYKSLSAFSQTFSQLVGVSPREYVRDL